MDLMYFTSTRPGTYLCKTNTDVFLSKVSVFLRIEYGERDNCELLKNKVRKYSLKSGCSINQNPEEWNNVLVVLDLISHALVWRLHTLLTIAHFTNLTSNASWADSSILLPDSVEKKPHNFSLFITI